MPHQEAPPEPVAATGDIDPAEVKAKLDRGDKFTLVDVREPHEFQICRIPGSTLIPLGELQKRLAELDPASRNRGPLQERRAQREGRRFPEASRAIRRSAT